MAEKTNIEWADSTYNHWEGCTKISPACDNCYAADRAARYKTVEWGGPRRLLSEANQKKPLKWERQAEKFFAEHGRRRRVFCSSLSDVFDNQVPEEWRVQLWDIIRQCPSMDWMLLTKRPQNIEKMKPPFWDEIKGRIWLGTTVENQEVANRNIPYLLKHDSAVLFLSCEPMLDHIYLNKIPVKLGGGGKVWLDALNGCVTDNYNKLCGKTNSIKWVIAGGESGPNARPSHPELFTQLQAQCEIVGVAFLFKQWGEWLPEEYLSEAVAASTYRADLKAGRTYRFTGMPMRKVGKKRAGRELEGKTYDGFPSVAA